MKLRLWLFWARRDIAVFYQDMSSLCNTGNTEKFALRPYRIDLRIPISGRSATIETSIAINVLGIWSGNNAESFRALDSGVSSAERDTCKTDRPTSVVRAEDKCPPDLKRVVTTVIMQTLTALNSTWKANKVQNHWINGPLIQSCHVSLVHE